MIQKIRFEDQAEWLAIRRNSIGGSDAAAIMGLSPFGSAYSLWAEKTGKHEPEDISHVEAVRLGHDLEDYVAHRFMEDTGLKVRRENSVLKNDEIPFAHATVDRLVIGQQAGLECKTTSVMSMKSFRNGEFPANYYCQCQHYMMVTGYPVWYLAVLILGKEFKVFRIERDEDDIRALREAEERFWQHVLDQTPPPASGTEADAKIISTMFPESRYGSEMQMFGREGIIQRWFEKDAEIKELTKERDAIKQELQLEMGDCETARCGSYKISWKTQVRAEHMVKASSSRVFRITESA